MCFNGSFCGNSPFCNDRQGCPICFPTAQSVDDGDPFSPAGTNVTTVALRNAGNEELKVKVGGTERPAAYIPRKRNATAQAA